MSKKFLWLDDERPKPDRVWDTVRSYNEFIDYITVEGVPDVISFDHDLGTGLTGYDCAMWLVTNDVDISDCDWRVHSENPVGAENIRVLLVNWTKYCNKRRYNEDS